MKTKSLAFIAGIIWLFAGFYVCRIGIHLYPSLPFSVLKIYNKQIQD